MTQTPKNEVWSIFGVSERVVVGVWIPLYANVNNYKITLVPALETDDLVF